MLSVFASEYVSCKLRKMCYTSGTLPQVSCNLQGFLAVHSSQGQLMFSCSQGEDFSEVPRGLERDK